MTIERKYKLDINLQPRPVWVCGNGKRKEDVTFLFSNEFKAFENRSDIYVMRTPLIRRFQEGSIELMLKYKKQIIVKLYRQYREKTNYIEDHDVNRLTDIISEIHNQ